MKAVILAAGLSSRIRSVTNGLPKCLLRFDDRAILDFQLDSLRAAGVQGVAVVVGWGKEKILDHIADRHASFCDRIHFLVNPNYARTNNIYSLWLARHWIGESDFLCLNADVLYHPEILLPAFATRADISMIIDEEFREETMKVVIRDRCVVAMRKGIPAQESSGTYIGITKFSRRACRPFFAAMKSLIDQGRLNEFFNSALLRLIDDGTRVYFTTTEGRPWTEIDDSTDLRFAEEVVYPRLAAELNAERSQSQAFSADQSIALTV